MSKIVTLLDPITQEAIYPVTSSESVIDKNGSTIGSIIQKQNEDIAEFGENIDKEIQDINVVANDAMKKAEAAAKSISTLQGLSNVNTSAETLAELVTQVEQNKSDIARKADMVDTDYVIADIEETLVTNAIRKTEQILTEDEKKQVRANIGAVSIQDYEKLVGNTVYLSESDYKKLEENGLIDESVEYNIFEDEESTATNEEEV